jgi:hypothetical protein
MSDPVPEFLKSLIIGYPTELFLALMVLAGAGLTGTVRRLRRLGTPKPAAVRNPTQGSGPLQSEPLLKLSDSLDALNERVDHLEAISDFDRQLKRGPEAQ